MPEEYVRKDVFDAHMQRIEALMALNLTEQRAMNERMESKMDALNKRMDAMNERLEVRIASLRTELKGDIKALDAKLYALEGKLSQNLVLTGVIVAIFGVIIAALQLWR